MRGLKPYEAAEYANNLLAPYPAAAPRRGQRSFTELMNWLDGHPLRMKLILPALNIAQPSELLEGLHDTDTLQDDDAIDRRITSLLDRILKGRDEHTDLPAASFD